MLGGFDGFGEGVGGGAVLALAGLGEFLFGLAGDGRLLLGKFVMDGLFGGSGGRSGSGVGLRRGLGGWLGLRVGLFCVELFEGVLGGCLLFGFAGELPGFLGLVFESCGLGLRLLLGILADCLGDAGLFLLPWLGRFIRF